jgi:hypothetical protein
MEDVVHFVRAVSEILSQTKMSRTDLIDMMKPRVWKHDKSNALSLFTLAQMDSDSWLESMVIGLRAVVCNESDPNIKELVRLSTDCYKQPDYSV